MNDITRFLVVAPRLSLEVTEPGKQTNNSTQLERGLVGPDVIYSAVICGLPLLNKGPLVKYITDCLT